MSLPRSYTRPWRIAPNFKRAIDGMLWAIATNTPADAAKRARLVARMALRLQRIREARERLGLTGKV
jgi:hypothetical protein